MFYTEFFSFSERNIYTWLQTPNASKKCREDPILGGQRVGSIKKLGLVFL